MFSIWVLSDLIQTHKYRQPPFVSTSHQHSSKQFSKISHHGIDTLLPPQTISTSWPDFLLRIIKYKNQRIMSLFKTMFCFLCELRDGILCLVIFDTHLYFWYPYGQWTKKWLKSKNQFSHNVKILNTLLTILPFFFLLNTILVTFRKENFKRAGCVQMVVTSNYRQLCDQTQTIRLSTSQYDCY